jgi:hypothetical protein
MDLGSFWYPTCDASGNIYCPADSNYSPIIIDVFDEGFHLTNLQGGVQFPMVPGKDPVQVSWTDPKFRNGWLVLDLNGNGTIDDLSEMFGNLTAQPTSDSPNGYRALAVFDDPHNGGNGNGFIDLGDSVFKKLRVWIDKNHNGKSEPDELLTLEALGITALKLKYIETPRTDSAGNAFRYRSTLVDSKRKIDHNTYDVYLQIQHPR